MSRDKGQHRFAIVVTTIGAGDFLKEYCRKAEEEGVREHLKIIVIPDRKSPVGLYDACVVLAREGFNIACPDISEQDLFLRRFGTLKKIIPYDSDNRRNIGFLMALEWGCDILVSIDDDNYCGQNTIFDKYAVVVGGTMAFPVIRSDTGWINLCDQLELEPNYQVFPRGYPYYARAKKPRITYRHERGSVKLNMGLWVGDPDLDALTWLVAPVRSKGFKKNGALMLGRNAWTPINTQNTSLHKDLVPVYYFIPMGYSIGGMRIDRYGDIFSGYFCQACVKHMEDRISVGLPVALHKRNAHNYMHDLTQEIACVWILEDLLPWLCQVKLHGSSYAETYHSLADAIDVQVDRFKGFIWNNAARAYMRHMTFCMRQWIKACRLLGVR